MSASDVAAEMSTFGRAEDSGAAAAEVAAIVRRRPEEAKAAMPRRAPWPERATVRGVEGRRAARWRAPWGVMVVTDYLSWLPTE